MMMMIGPMRMWISMRRKWLKQPQVQLKRQPNLS